MRSKILWLAGMLAVRGSGSAGAAFGDASRLSRRFPGGPWILR